MIDILTTIVKFQLDNGYDHAEHYVDFQNDFPSKCEKWKNLLIEMVYDAVGNVLGSSEIIFDILNINHEMLIDGSYTDNNFLMTGVSLMKWLSIDLDNEYYEKFSGLYRSLKYLNE